MKLLNKVVLTLSWIIVLIYMITFISNEFFKWFTLNIIPFEYQNLVINCIYFPALIYLIYRIWSFKHTDKHQKWKWTFALLFAGMIFMPIYIWKKDDSFMQEQKKYFAQQQL